MLLASSLVLHGFVQCYSIHRIVVTKNHDNSKPLDPPFPSIKRAYEREEDELFSLTFPIAAIRSCWSMSQLMVVIISFIAPIKLPFWDWNG